MGEVVHLIFVPGMFDFTESWAPVLPSYVKLVRCEWYSSLADAMSGPGRQSGGPGDIVEVAALRALVEVIRLAQSGRRWALAGHSAGGTVVYRLLDHLLLLVRSKCVCTSLVSAAQAWLSEEEGCSLVTQLQSMHMPLTNLPEAVCSFEGTLVSCEVEGWAKDWEGREAAPDDEWVHVELINPLSEWTWPMARACAGSLWCRCGQECPARHLASIERWLALPESPCFVYVAGERSSWCRQHVFSALQQVSGASANVQKLQLEEVSDAGHNMNRHQPEVVKELLRTIIPARSEPQRKIVCVRSV